MNRHWHNRQFMRDIVLGERLLFDVVTTQQKNKCFLQVLQQIYESHELGNEKKSAIRLRLKTPAINFSVV